MLSEGLVVRGFTDIPGILLSGSVASGGGFGQVWGKKVHAQYQATWNATGDYTVYHSVGHTDYSVQITPETDERVSYVPRSLMGTSSFRVYFKDLGAAASDSAFSFQIIGRNY